MKMVNALLLVLFLALSNLPPAFSADSTSIAGRDVSSQDSIPAGFVAVWPMDAAIPKGWLPCDGQPVPADCPTLRGLMSHVPNYNTQRQFLRGTTSGAGTLVADSVRSHAHGMDQHSHTVSGTAGAQYYSANVGPQSISGWANGQAYSNSGGTSEKVRLLYKTGTAEHGPSTVDIYQNVEKEICVPDWLGNMPMGCIDFPSGSGTTAYTSGSAISGQTSGTSVSGWTGGSNISGYTSLAGSTSTHAAGGAETAPAHTLVKYIIKAH